MPFAYFHRLSPSRQRLYLASDAVERVDLPSGPDLSPLIAQLLLALSQEQRLQVERHCRALVVDLGQRLSVPPLTVKVLNVRPSGDWGELHGLYEPAGEGRRRARVTLWMRTVTRRQVVASRTFLRTLLHEFCHHLDYEHFRWQETFHTEGFYKRESSLLSQLLPQARAPGLPRARACADAGDNA